MKKIISILLILCLMPTSAAFAAEAEQIGPVDRIYSDENYAVKTPEENLFSVEGSDKEFILLDDANGFYVMAKDHYGKRAFDPDGTQKFNPDDANNIAYWLNHDFIEKGNGVGNKLPDEMIQYIIPDRTWFTEGGIPQGDCPKDYTVTTGIALMSQLEWKQYSGIFGVIDNIGVYGWWLRTARGKNGTLNSVLCSMTTAERTGETFGQISSNANDYYVRPVFYLQDNFFKEVRLDKIGSNVGKTLAKHFEVSDFQGEGKLNYDDKLLRTLGFDIPFEITHNDMRINANIVKGEYNTKLSGGSTQAEIVCSDEDQLIQTAFAMDARRNYELVLRAGFDGVSKKDGVTLLADYYTEDGTRCGKTNEVLRIGGTKAVTEYVTNLVSAPEDTYFIIFSLSIPGGMSGKVNFDSLFLREIKPVVTISHQWAPTYVIDNRIDTYKVRIECETTLPKNFTTYYKLTYSTDEAVYQSTPEKLQLSTKGVGEYTVEMKNLHKGNAELEIYVLYGNNVVGSLKNKVAVTTLFDWNADSGLLKHGVCTHPAQIERSKGVILDYIKQAGMNYIRGDFSWTRLEKGSKGNYDYTALDYIMSELKKRDMGLIAILCYSNTLYAPRDKAGIADNETLEAFLQYVRTVVKRYPEIKYFEIWNEPNNNGFWYPLANPNDYANFVKAVSRAIKETRPDAYVVGGAIDISKNGPGWSREIFDYGIYPYIDAFSTHPYYHTALNDAKYLDRVKNYTDIVEDYGGWKDVYLTEAGWTTYGKEELEPTLAGEDIKVLIHADYLNTWVLLFNMWDESETFGLLKPDYRAKAGFSAVVNYENQTAGAQLITKANLKDNLHTFIYRKNNKPMLISWCYTGEEETLEFEQSVTVYDMYGNLVSEGKTVQQTEDPCYIYSNDNRIFTDGISARIGMDIDAFLVRYKGVLSEELKEKIKAKKEQFAGAVSADIEDLNGFYALGSEIMNSLGDDLYGAANTNMMYQVHKIGLEIADFVSLSQAGFENRSAGKVAEGKKKMTALLADASDTKRFSYELIRNAEKYSQLAVQASKSAKVEKGIAFAYDAVAENLAIWAEQVMEREASENIGIYFQVVPGLIEAYEGEPASIKVYAYNHRSVDATGTLSVQSSKGVTLAKIEGVKIPAKGKTLQELSLHLDNISFGNELLKISFEGETTATSLIKANIKSKLAIKLENAEETVSELKSLRLKLENKTDSSLSGKVKITPPEGWRTSGEQSFELGAAEVSELTIPVTATERTAFNHYVFDIEVTDSNGKIVTKAALPLDFSVVVKANEPMSPSAFDGDISDWIDAYPSYLNVPSEINNAEEWKNSDMSARVFTKWDDSYFYIMADIYDDHHNQMNHEGIIYDGDSIQVAFDTQNTKSTKYDGDDYEYGFALTRTGEESYAWQAADGEPTGVYPPEWCRVLRDDENKHTRYLIRIPKENLAPMKFVQGYRFGFNLVLNDGNLLGPREGYYEITPGIASSKNPSYFRNWTLIPGEAGTQNRIEDISAIFGVKMGEVSVFSDIRGHWGEAAIQEAYAMNLVKGIGNNQYAPDQPLTVAEAFALVSRVIKTAPAESTYADINGDEWYAQTIGGMQATGLIPAEMVRENLVEPNKVITREEFAAVLAKARPAETVAQYDFKDMDTVSPWAKQAVIQIAHQELMIGDEHHNFNPKGGLTRAEAAVIILKLNAG